MSKAKPHLRFIAAFLLPLAVLFAAVMPAEAATFSSATLFVPGSKTSYSAVAIALTPAATPTDFLTVTGSATKTIKITYASCSGLATAAGTSLVLGFVRTTLDVGGTSTVVPIAPRDPQNTPATASVKAYSANPTTLGTSPGPFRSAYLSTTTAGAGAAGNLNWDMVPVQTVTQAPTLRGVNQSFALNGNGVSFGAGTVLVCNVAWTEE